MRTANRKPVGGPKRTSICLGTGERKSPGFEALPCDITMWPLIARALAASGIYTPPEELEA